MEYSTRVSTSHSRLYPYTLSYLLDPKVQLQFIDRKKSISELPDGFSDYFLYNVSLWQIFFSLIKKLIMLILL